MMNLVICYSQMYITQMSKAHRPKRHMLPIHGIGVILPVAGRVLSIELLVSRNTVPYRVCNGQLVFTIPEIADHEVVVIKT